MSASEHDVTTVDLRTDVPTGWNLVGLSDPKFDGINYYREIQGTHAFLEFKLNTPQFVQVEYQLYSRSQGVTSRLFMDGALLQQRRFAKNKLEEKERAGVFVKSGTHTISWDFKCSEEPCDDPLKQYLTQVKLIKRNGQEKSEEVGVHVFKEILDDPQTSLKVSGAGALEFDGINFLRRITSKNMQLSWSDEGAINAVLYVYSPQVFKVTARLKNKVVDIQKNSKSEGALIAISLAQYPQVRTLDIEIDCLGKSNIGGCAYIYSPYVIFRKVDPISKPELSTIILLVGVILFTLWKFLFFRGSSYGNAYESPP
ncbi:hypothetical protein [Deinococcus actinosclerus]|uniref:hypothetical protein n=1 Tax=Deinococcus actinosclerus TaxID=1768108 RepID=UPI0012FABC79|nr:hypothetical protein [Deinococcus actinosclerus]